jgi:hypothetical protein
VFEALRSAKPIRRGFDKTECEIGVGTVLWGGLSPRTEIVSGMNAFVNESTFLFCFYCVESGIRILLSQHQQKLRDGDVLGRVG